MTLGTRERPQWMQQRAVSLAQALRIQRQHSPSQADAGGPDLRRHRRPLRTYTGRDMTSAHAGMNIRGPEFDALVEDLVKSLDKFKVPARAKNELLGVLGPMKGDIVGR